MFNIVFAILCALFVVATLMPLLPLKAWWVRSFDFPRVQFLFLGAIFLIGYMVVADLRLHLEAWPDWTVVAFTSFALAYQLFRIVPYTLAASFQVEPSSRDSETTIQLLIANVLTPNDRYDDLKAIIREADPDIVLLVECDQRWLDELALSETYPCSVERPLDNLYGMAFYTRLGVEDVSVHYLVQDDIPSVRARILLSNGDTLDFRGLHPRPPAPSENDSSVERDAELLLVADDLRDASGPVVVAGDMNDVAWSPTTRQFQRISRLLDPRIGRGLFSTFSAEHWFLRWPLDHVFVSKELRVVNIERLAYFGSDHFPISITLSYEPEGAASQPEPNDADDGDEQEVQETVEEAEARN